MYTHKQTHEDINSAIYAITKLPQQVFLKSKYVQN